jgi:hypothetical protein
MMILPYVAIFLLLAVLTWRGGRGEYAYFAAAFFGIGAAFYTIGNGFRDDAPYAWAVTLGLLAVGYLRDRI